MGQGVIQNEIGSGQYLVRLVYDGRAENEQKISILEARIIELQVIYDPMPETTVQEIWDKRIVGLQIDSVRKQKEYFENYFPDDPVISAYCADPTTGLTGNVGTIEVNGELITDYVNIQPGENGNAVYNAQRDGILTPSLAGGPWGVFLNRCMLPGWQKFKPLHRYGRVTAGSIDTVNDTCTVALFDDRSSATIQGEYVFEINQSDILRNVPVEYMDCNASVLADGDIVLIEFINQDWNDPVVIGFANNPRLCAASDVYALYGQYNNAWEYPAVKYSGVSDSWASIGGYSPSTTTIQEENFAIFLRNNLAASHYYNYLFVYGGYYHENWYQANTEWSEDEDFPASHVLSICEQLDKSSETWSLKASMPSGKSYTSAWHLENIGYVYGGTQFDDRDQLWFREYLYPEKKHRKDYWMEWYEVLEGNLHYCKVVEEVSPGVFYWLGAMGVVPIPKQVNGYTECNTGGTLGYNFWNYEPTDGWPHYTYLDEYVYQWSNVVISELTLNYVNSTYGTMHKFNYELDSWASGAALSKRFNHAHFDISGKGYVAGGYSEDYVNIEQDGQTEYFMDSVKSYSPSGSSWTTETSLPEKRYAARGFMALGKGYIFGGETVNSVYADDAEIEYGYEAKTYRPIAAGADYTAHPATRVTVYAVKALNEFNPTTGIWANRTQCTANNRGDYPAHGMTVSGLAATTGGNFEYQVDADTWTAKAAATRALSGAAMTA